MKELEIDERSTVPIWLQLRNRLIYLITSGHYKAGEKLPTVRELAINLKINYNTVNKVYLSLIHDGYIVSFRGKGTFVDDISKSRNETQSSPADGVIDLMIDRCLEIGVPLDDIANQVARRIEQYKANHPDRSGEGR
ncbi:GntR family transcriptional regulator [Adlercreutzia sp. R7]|uniref:GntR family transcriptional regulator n=1 Tax=Adlercreutzia wanghongyangiae TaxID=3111451 RepID=A0ABU6IF92_9ACTN|nr:GntR family transcriptional regulator [Adlercreutzia sp. R7]